MKFSLAIYGESVTEMNYQYSLTPQKSELVDEFEVTINGAVSKLKGGTQHSYVAKGRARGRGISQIGSLKLVGGGGCRSRCQDVMTDRGAVFRFFAARGQDDRQCVQLERRTSGRDQQPTRRSTESVC